MMEERRSSNNNTKRPSKVCSRSTILRLSTPKPIHPDNIPDKPSIYWLDYLEQNANLRLRTPGELKQYYEQFYTKLPRLEKLSRPRVNLCEAADRPCTANGIPKSALNYTPTERIRRLSQPRYVSQNYKGTGLFVTYRKPSTAVETESRTDWNNNSRKDSGTKILPSPYLQGSNVKTDTGITGGGDLVKSSTNSVKPPDSKKKLLHLPKLPASSVRTNQGKAVRKSKSDMHGFKKSEQLPLPSVVPSARNIDSIHTNDDIKPKTILPPLKGSKKKKAKKPKKTVSEEVTDNHYSKLTFTHFY